MSGQREQLNPIAEKTIAGKADAVSNSPQAMWFLSGRLNSNSPVRYIPVDSKPFIVGRRADATLRLSSNNVSSTHAELLDNGTNLVLRDPGSTNGTFVNGERVSEPVSLNADDLIQFADVPFRVMYQACQYGGATTREDVLDQAMVLVHFDKLMNEHAVIPHYQPIVDLPGENPIGFEVLARSNLDKLRTPNEMFSAAAQLGLEIELSQIMRLTAIQETSSFPNPPHLFLNTHPSELEKPGLIESMRSLRALKKSQQITLEIHEKAVTNCSKMQELQKQLQELNIDLAFDDFGAGQARLVELVEIHPKYLKFDMSLIRGIHKTSAERQRLVASLTQMSRDVGAIPLAEGIECEAERDVCVELGFELAQGFYFGHPIPLKGKSCESAPAIGPSPFVVNRGKS